MKPPCSDEALKTKTGRNWLEWCNLLDEDGAKALTHKELARLVESMHSAGGWWSQTIAVGYEQLSGKRLLHERSDSTFSASASKTIPVSAAKVHTFFTEEQKRLLWLRERIIIRTSSAPKSARITWPDKTNVAVWITEKSEDKCVVAVEHSKLISQSDVIPQKQFWKTSLLRLMEVTM